MRTLRDRTISYRPADHRTADRWLVPTLAGDRRWVRRVACRTSAAFRECQRTRVGVELVNLSTHGCAVRSAETQRVGAHCWIILPTFESWDSNVAWCKDGLFGLDFAKPLHRAVAELIIQRSSLRLPAAAAR